jgi:hypothetical protein
MPGTKKRQARFVKYRGSESIMVKIHDYESEGTDFSTKY